MKNFTATLAGAVLLLGCSNQLRVTTEGLGTGFVVSEPAGILCGSRCAHPFARAGTVTLTAAPGADSVFAGWRGECRGMALDCVLPASGQRAAAAMFALREPLPSLPPTALTPADIEAHLRRYPQINSAARFIEVIESPEDEFRFKDNWILMARSESLQTGHAASPRVLLPSGDSTTIFSIALTSDPAFRHADPLKIEMMQFDAGARRFRFHEIDLARRSVTADDARCAHCHFGRPNWDAYDSWAGMLPFNRDRIYKGSIEAAALRRTLNLMDKPPAVRALLERLNLPGTATGPVIARLDAAGAAFGAIVFPTLDDPLPAGGVAAPVLIEAGLATLPGLAPSPASYPPGEPALSTVVQGPDRSASEASRGFLRLMKTAATNPDEGRGVDLFDQLTPLNMRRIAQELIDASRPGAVRDLRPIALAVAMGCSNALEAALPAAARQFLNARHGLGLELRPGEGLAAIRSDTLERRRMLPTLKADLQLETLLHERGLIAVHGAATTASTSTSVARLRQELFRRPREGDFILDSGPSRLMIDREFYFGDDGHVADHRYFLEPFGVPVDKWSMSVMGRSRTYTFGDYFARDEGDVLMPALRDSLTASGWRAPFGCPALVAASLTQFAGVPAAGAPPSAPEVQRVFDKHCLACHGLFALSGGTRGRSLDGPYAPSLLGTSDWAALFTGPRPAIVPGNPDASPLFQRLRTIDPALRMPPSSTGPALSAADIDVVRRFILSARR